MYKETDENGQYMIDCRLSGERNMDENVNVMIQFATDIRKEEVGEARVRNRHEGYGFLADAHQNVIRAMKNVKDGMNGLLDALPTDDVTAVDKTESVANALADAIVATVRMAAEAKRVSGDLFTESWNPTPLESLAAENDGFAEPEPENGDGEKED